MASQACNTLKGDGSPCRAPPLHDAELCLMHSPEHAEEVAEARRLGGLRRRKEKAVSGAYDFEGLGSILRIRRLLEVAILDTLSLENSVARSRTLAYLAQVAVNLLEKGELESRLAAMEGALGPRLVKQGRRR